MSKIMYSFVFLRKINDTYFKYKVVSRNNFSEKLLKVKDKTFNVVNSDAFLTTQTDWFKNLKYVYYFDWDSGVQITSETSGSQILTPELLDFIVDSNIMKYIAISLKERSSKFPVFEMIMGLVSGLGLGCIIAYLYLNDKYIMILK